MPGSINGRSPHLLVPLLMALAVTCSSPTSVPAGRELRCSSSSELACIDSPDCTLVLATGQPPGAYSCRAAEGPCETGFRQRTGTQEACEAKPGCEFVPGQCYCSPDVTCVCSGGPPPQCRRRGLES